MEWIAQEEMENQAVAGLCEAILSLAVFEFTFEQWEVVEVDIRAAEDRETALIKELDKLKEQDTIEKEDIKGEENELTVQDDTQSVANELRDLEEEMDAAEQAKASMRAAGQTEKALKNAGYVFKDKVQNSELDGALSKQTKKDKKREKRKMKKEEKIRETIAKEEKKVVQLYFKMVDKIMKGYTKDVKSQHKKEVKGRKKMEKTERKAQKMLEKEMKRMEKEGVKNEKKKKAQTMVVKENHSDIKKRKTKKETGNNKGHVKKEA